MCDQAAAAQQAAAQAAACEPQPRSWLTILGVALGATAAGFLAGCYGSRWAVHNARAESQANLALAVGLREGIALTTRPIGLKESDTTVTNITV